MENIYDQYALIRAKKAELETQEEAIKVKILEDMVARDSKKEVHTLGSFTISKLKKWEYPENVVKLEEKFKVAKVKAQNSGEATYTEVESLRFTPVTI